jgi:hypothetical protein
MVVRIALLLPLRLVQVDASVASRLIALVVVLDLVGAVGGRRPVGVVTRDGRTVLTASAAV